MKITSFTAIALCALMISTQVQAAKEPLRLKQTSQWNVDYADERCRLIRKFGEGEEQVYLLFDQFGPGEHFRMTLAGKPVKTSIVDGEVTIQFGPAEAEQKVGFYKGDLGKEPALLLQAQTRLAAPTPAEQAAIDKAPKGEWVELAPIAPERQSAIRTLTIGKPLRRAVVLETGPMRKPMEAMSTCIDSMLASWGIDVERHKKLTRAVEPASSPGDWVISRDYPVKMLSAGQPAIVEFRLSVDAQGNPTSCFIQLTSRPKEFDKAVCGALMKRARFIPALDEAGEPIASYYRNTVHFKI
jgi:hypothetical protein